MRGKCKIGIMKEKKMDGDYADLRRTLKIGIINIGYGIENYADMRGKCKIGIMKEEKMDGDYADLRQTLKIGIITGVKCETGTGSNSDIWA